MASIRLSARAFADLERIFEFLAERDPATALAATRRIRDAILILSDHPLIGRRADALRRELIVSYGRTGYVALYRWFPKHDTVLVLAIRHQREAGYAGE